ncbi:DegT/DnrJ/EryC1/StrS family aminotransferase [Actinomadura sp. K4S16]|uniref:DegT/DnrJ/EryC1/StrS family aminotransferase n=1 Tax=Actinomadura sp. K4S16 TaxID=1316147 RepID=UPI00135C52B3|nr:DegT/DnrJ/EryC1/StrS family aminotransferase [Actinomadura sp. K4S16]
MTVLNLAERRWPPVPDLEETRLITQAALSRTWTDGPWTEEVEHRMTELTGAPHAVAFNSCTSALHAALHAMGCAAGTPLLAPSLTFTGSLTGARHIGADVHWRDVDPDTLTITLGPIEEVGTLVLAVDLHGVPHTITGGGGLRVLTDSCQALGTLRDGRHIGGTGTHCWSFSSAKLVAAPDGGAVTTDDPDLARILRQLRDYGVYATGRERSNGVVTHPGGHNWRPSELSMAMVAHRLQRLPYWADRARHAARRLHPALDRLGYWRQHAAPGTDPAWHKIRIGPPDQDPDAARQLARRLADAGVPTHRWGAHPLHLHPVHHTRDRPRPDLPATARAAAGTICLGTERCPPMTWTCDEIDEVIDTLDILTEG